MTDIEFIRFANGKAARIWSPALFQNDQGILDVSIRNLFCCSLRVADRDHVSNTISIVERRTHLVTEFLEKDNASNRVIDTVRQLNQFEYSRSIGNNPADGTKPARLNFTQLRYGQPQMQVDQIRIKGSF